ncbi:MAG: EAL domain-containing protein [Methylococcales bacterium]|nr:MAG: EAL domain-containing protein [Methylococcales bacterium]
MKHQQDALNTANANLRLQAESLLANEVTNLEQFEDLSPEALLTLVQELRLHQIELKLQNDELRLKQVELDRAKSRYFDLYDLAPVAYLIVNSSDSITQANLAAAQLLGAPKSRLFSSYIFNDDLARYYDFIARFKGSEGTQSLILRVVTSDNHYYWVSLEAVLGLDVDDESVLFITLINIDELIKAQADLRIAAVAFESQQGIMVTDAHCEILRINSSYTNITGYSAADVLGKNPRIFSSGRQSPEFYKNMWETIVTQGSWSGELWNQRKNHEFYLARLRITQLKDAYDQVSHYVSKLVDITETQTAKDEAHRLTFFDALTELPNRRLLYELLKPVVTSSQRSGCLGALLFIDLDDFKAINDSLGHEVGDQLLLRVSRRLLQCIRKSDIVAHLGADEFVVVMDGLSEQSEEAAAQIEDLGEVILAVISQLEHRNYRCTASIGVVMFGKQEVSIDELLKQADIAMVHAKQSGTNSLRFFDPKMQVSINARLELKAGLRKALDKQQFMLFYQAQVNGLQEIVGAEALIRWQHPDKGFISPLDFIPLAESTGMILPIGRWVLEKACDQLQLWAADERTEFLQLSVNVSMRQFYEADFVAQVHQLLKDRSFNPARLKLELTESLVLKGLDDAREKMHELGQLGISFSMDDFGTGYSSLANLKSLSFDQLKIDQSFVRDICDDEDDVVIVKAIIAMAKSLEMDVIAEGVETHAQRELLAEYGCQLYQGYLFSKPVPIEQFMLLL